MFYIQGVTKDNNIALVKITANTWIIDSLEANCLLGNMWFMLCHICIDYDSTNLSFLSFDNFCIPFNIQKRANPIVCKVILV